MCFASASTGRDTAPDADTAGKPDESGAGGEAAAWSLVWQSVAAHHAEEPSSLLGDLTDAEDPHRL